MSTSIDKETIREGYEDVRDDNTETCWITLKYDEHKCIALAAMGNDFDEFRNQFTDDERVYSFIRIRTGDEMSKRSKFAFITWVGDEVGALPRARMSTDKSLVKEVILSFAKELNISDHEELTEDFIREEITKTGGANYGTGVRD